MTKFSIIIPLYNKEKDILETITSVLKQSYTNFEIIVVNDGSTDSSEEKITSVSDKRLKYFSKENEGVALTRNFGVKKATYEYIVFLDADDHWHGDHLENLNGLIEKFPEYQWYATAYEKKYSNREIHPMDSPVLKLGTNWQGIIPNYFEYSLIDSLGWTSAVCFKKDFFESLNGFDATITHGAGEDTDLWIRAAIESPLVFSNKITATYNLIGSNRISKTPTLKRNFMKTEPFEAEANKDPFLKKYLDVNNYSFAIQHKLANDLKSCKEYRSKIDLANLTSKQRFLLKQPRWVLKLFLLGKFTTQLVGVRLTTYK